MTPEIKSYMRPIDTDSLYIEKREAASNNYFLYTFECVFFNGESFTFTCIDKNLHHARYQKNITLKKRLSSFIGKK